MTALPHSDYPADLNRAIEQLWPGRGWHAAPLSGGMTNLSWRVQVDGVDHDLFLQLLMPQELAGRVGIDRDVHQRALAVADSLGVAPASVAVLDDPAVIVTEFVAGEPLPAHGPLRDRALTEVAGTLRRLHRHPVDPSLTGLCADGFSGTRWMAHQARRANPVRAAAFDPALAALDRFEMARGEVEPSLLHADLSVNNILVGDRTWLIDWEYSGTGDGWYDLGDLAWKCGLSADEEIAVAAAYVDREPTEREVALVRVYRFVGMLREGLWALAAGAVGFSDFDHGAYAQEVLGKLDATLASPEFATAMEAV